MILRRLALAFLLAAAPLASFSAAGASPPLGAVPSYCVRTEPGFRCMIGPFDIEGGEMHEIMTGVAAPSEAGYITSGQAKLVNSDGEPVSHHQVHLHHAVWLNPYERDMTCDSYDDGSFPGYERFFATGKEATEFVLPQGYGYRWDPKVSQPLSGSAPWWAFTAHLDGMHGASDVYVQFDMDYVPDAEADGLTNLEPVWLDVRNCRSDPVYDVDEGSGVDKERWTYKMPTSGRFVFLGGHLHDGGLSLTLENLTRDEEIYTSRAMYSIEREPWFLTKMSTWSNKRGIPVQKGDNLRLTATYDNSRARDGVMGIMLGALVPTP